MRAEILRELEDREPTCGVCGQDVEDAGDHADTYGHWPTPRRPRWLDRLEAQDRTGEIRHNG